MPHSILLYKLWSIGVTGTLWHWFQCYLSNCHHLEDQPSALLNVKSGVPQGSILGPLLFLIFLNDLPSCISHSSLLLFADDSKVQNIISSSHDALHLQSNIDSLVAWTYTNSLLLNPKKCAAIRFSLSHTDSPSYSIEGCSISVRHFHRDLGIMVCGDLSWSTHHNHICSKAYSVMYRIHRTFSSSASVSLKKQLYVALVRSTMCYGSQLWRPHRKKDILILERVQHRATKHILLDYSSNYRERLLDLSLLPLMYWYELNDIMYFVKALKNPSDNFSVFDYVSFSNNSNQSSTTHKLIHNYTRTSTHRHFYFNRIIRLWNNLPPIDLSKSVQCIKSHLYPHLWNNFLCNFDPNYTCSFHYLCPCSSCLTKFHSYLLIILL